MFESSLSKKRLGHNGAALQNLLKLFEALVNSRLSNAPNIPASVKSKQLVIY